MQSAMVKPAEAGNAAGGEVVEFGWEEEGSNKPLTGRRLKAQKEQKKKNRSGTFGECFQLILGIPLYSYTIRIKIGEF